MLTDTSQWSKVLWPVTQALFPVDLPTLISGGNPKLFLGIFRQALLKPASLFYTEYVKKIFFLN